MLYVLITVGLVCAGACGSSLSGPGVGKLDGTCHVLVQLLSLVAILNKHSLGGCLCAGSFMRLPQENELPASVMREDRMV